MPKKTYTSKKPPYTLLTWKNLPSERKKRGVILGLVEDVRLGEDEHFRFHPAKGILTSSSPRRGLMIKGGAIAGYYFRRSYPGMTPLPSEMYKPRGKYGIALVVYSNDTCLTFSSGYSIKEGLIFPKKNIREGVIGTLDLIRKINDTGIVAELSPQEFDATIDFICRDLETGEHTEGAKTEGQILDALHGMG